MAKTVYATLIGDVVASRKAADRATLHRALREALICGNDVFHPVQPLEPTVGDEFPRGF